MTALSGEIWTLRTSQMAKYRPKTPRAQPCRILRFIGKQGVERSYEKQLRGEKGVEILLRDAQIARASCRERV